MRLADFPRPANKSVRGVHWSGWDAHPEEADLGRWIELCQQMGIGWVTLLDTNGSSINVCRGLVRAGIMPIVRHYAHRPCPSTMTAEQMTATRRLVDVGVGYFLDPLNEWNLLDEWQSSSWSARSPQERAHIAMACWLENAEAILDRGGLPGLPPLAQCSHNTGPASIGSIPAYIDSIAYLSGQPRRDRALSIFERGGWIGTHLAVLNHCYKDAQGQWHFEYPLDPICQADQSGKTIMQDDNSLIGYRVVLQLLAGHLSQDLAENVAVASTEGGLFTDENKGWNRDARYPSFDDNGHAERVVAMFEWIRRREPQVICECNWMLADHAMNGRFVDGGKLPPWEVDCWITKERTLPVVKLMRDTASQNEVTPPYELNPPDETFKYSEAQIVEFTRAAARKVDINEELFLRLVREECRSRRREYDYKWIEPRTFATGCCQLMPADFNASASGFYRIADLKDPVANLRAGSLYLVSLFREFGTWEKGIAAWNWGPGNLRKLLKAGYTRSWMAWLPDETRKLIRLVLIDGPRLALA